MIEVIQGSGEMIPIEISLGGLGSSGEQGIQGETGPTYDDTIIKSQLANMATQVSLASSNGIKGDNVTDDFNSFNTLLITKSDTSIDLNVGRCKLSATLNVTQANTSIEGHSVSSGRAINDADSSNNYRKSVLSADHNGIILNVDIPSAENGCDIRKITLDGNNLATVGINYANYSFGRNLLEDVNVVNVNGTALQYNGYDYATRVNRFYTRFTNKGLVMNGDGHYNVIFENCRFLAKQCCELFLEATSSSSKQIVFRGCDFETYDALAGDVQNWLKIGGAKEVVFEDCFFESSLTALHSESLIQLGTDTAYLASVSFIRCHFSPVNTDYIFDWKNVGQVTIDNCYFESGETIKIINASSNNLYSKSCYPISYWTNTAINDITALIGTADVNPAKKMEDLFCIITGKTSYSKPTFRKSISIAPDSNGIVLQAKDQDIITYPYEYVRISKAGFNIGSGTSPLDVAFVRYGVNIGGMSGTQSFKVDGTYNGGHQILGTTHLWVDALGKPRVKNTAIPYSDTDGYSLVRAQNIAPTSATATGVAGDIVITTGYIYICVATNTWQRVAIATW